MRCLPLPTVDYCSVGFTCKVYAQKAYRMSTDDHGGYISTTTTDIDDEKEEENAVRRG